MENNSHASFNANFNKISFTLAKLYFSALATEYAYYTRLMPTEFPDYKNGMARLHLEPTVFKNKSRLMEITRLTKGYYNWNPQCFKYPPYGDNVINKGKSACIGGERYQRIYE